MYSNYTAFCTLVKFCLTMYVSAIPGVPYGNVVPIVFPCDHKQVQGVVIKQVHAPIINSSASTFIVVDPGGE